MNTLDSARLSSAVRRQRSGQKHPRRRYGGVRGGSEPIRPSPALMGEAGRKVKTE